MKLEWIKNIARLYLPVYLYNTVPMKIAYAGYSTIKKNYYARLFLNLNNHETFLGRHLISGLPRLIPKHDIDIIVAEISPIALNDFMRFTGYIIPEWATMRINLDRPLSEICRQSVSDFADVTRLIRKYRLTYEILTDTESFKYFNERMYLPFIKKRHKEEAWVIDLNSVWRSSPSPVLMAIKENNTIVAAALIRKSGDSLYLIHLGILDGNEEFLRHGVIGAIYYFGVIEGKRLDCRYLDVGGSRPFLTDRLTEYKIGLGAEFLSDLSPRKEYLWLGINMDSSVARAFLQNNPFMHLNKECRLVRSGSENV